jgi:hypothetical protein
VRASNFALQICQIDALAVAWMLVGCRGPGTRGTCRNGVTVEAAARSSNGSGSIAERASRLAPGSGLAPRGEQGRPDQLVRRGLGELVPYGLRRAEVSMRGAVAGCSLGQLGAFVQQRPPRLSTPAPPRRTARRPTQVPSSVHRAAWPEPGVECVGTRPGEHQQKERPAVHDREFTAVADRPEPVRKVLGEVRDSHLAGGDESSWTREQSKGDQDAGDQFDQPGEPDERASGRDGIRRPAEQQGRAVAQEQESEEDPEQAQDCRCMRVESGFQPLGHGLTIRKTAALANLPMQISAWLA